MVPQYRGPYEQVVEWISNGLVAAERQGHEQTMSALLGNLGIVYRSRGRYEEAIAQYEQSLVLAERVGDVPGAMRTYWNLGLLHEAKGDLTSALPHMERRVEWEEQIRHSNAVPDRAQVEVLRERLHTDATRDGHPNRSILDRIPSLFRR